jgi:hypothetical protein
MFYLIWIQQPYRWSTDCIGDGKVCCFWTFPIFIALLEPGTVPRFLELALLHASTNPTCVPESECVTCNMLRQLHVHPAQCVTLGRKNRWDEIWARTGNSKRWDQANHFSPVENNSLCQDSSHSTDQGLQATQVLSNVHVQCACISVCYISNISGTRQLRCQEIGSWVCYISNISGTRQLRCQEIGSWVQETLNITATEQRQHLYVLTKFLFSRRRIFTNLLSIYTTTYYITLHYILLINLKVKRMVTEIPTPFPMRVSTKTFLFRKCVLSSPVALGTERVTPNGDLWLVLYMI